MYVCSSTAYSDLGPRSLLSGIQQFLLVRNLGNIWAEPYAHLRMIVFAYPQRRGGLRYFFAIEGWGYCCFVEGVGCGFFLGGGGGLTVSVGGRGDKRV